MVKHKWDCTPEEAIKIQRELSSLVELVPFTGKIKFVGGADVSFNRFSNILFAGIVVLSYPELQVVEYLIEKSETDFPYIPGLLSFREAPALIDVWKKIKIKPDVLVVDGQGIAHPRSLGIASHLGLALDVPTVGSAKSLLFGKYEEPNSQAGSVSFLFDRYTKGEVIGGVVRTKDKVKPVFVSPGHRTSVEQSIELVLDLTRGYRLPEPTRLAHEFVNKFRRENI